MTWAIAAATRLAAPGIATRRALVHGLDRHLRDLLGVDPHDLGQRVVGVLLAEAGALAEAGVDRAGTQRRGRDARPAQLAGEALGVRQHERLAGAVPRLAGQGLERRRAGDVEDGAAAALDHARQETAAQVDDGDDVDLDHLHLVLGRRPRDRSEGGEAGVVDEHVGGEAEPGDPVEQPGTRRPVGEVGGEHGGAAALGGDLLGQRLELVGGAGDQGDVVAATDELARDLGADALRGAGDHTGAVGTGQGKAHARTVGRQSSQAPGPTTENRAAMNALFGPRLLESQLEPARQDRPAGAQRHRRDVGDDLVEQPGVRELPGELAAADDPDVLAAGGLRHLRVHGPHVARART